MVPMIVLAATAVVLVAVVLAVATGRLRVDGLADATRTVPDHGLGPEPLAAEVSDVRFDTAPRGYRREDVDARLADLRDTLADREREVDRLRERDVDRLRERDVEQPDEHQGSRPGDHREP